MFGAVPVTVLAVAAGAAFTFGQDVSQLNGTQEQTDYLVVASNTTSSANSWSQKAYIGGAPGLTGSLQNITVATKYGELPQWFQVDTGATGVPSAVQEAGDLAFINGASSTTTPDDTNNGGTAGGTDNLNAVQAIHVKGNITNVAALRQAYGTCLIPIRLWSTVDDGGAFTDVTQTYLDTQNRLSDGTNGQTASTANPNGSGTDPYYVDCTTGEFEFTVPTDAAADHKTSGTLAYEISVERGGVFATFNNNTGAQPEFVFQATPIAYDPTNQFNTPGGSGNSQYTPNLKSDVRKAAVTVTASSPSAITAGADYPTITFTTNPSPITWISQPTCGVYASSDTSYNSPQTGASTAGTYVTHCTGGTSARYSPTQANGALTVNAAAPVGNALPNWQAMSYTTSINFTAYSTWSADHPILWTQFGTQYRWMTLADFDSVFRNSFIWPYVATTTVTGSINYLDSSFYYSPDGLIYTAFPA